MYASDFMVNSPYFVFAISLVVLWLSEWIGTLFRRRRGSLGEDEREDFHLIAAATLTLLGLIIGFTFSMAISRYDERKTYEEAEANAIGTEYVRADLLPGGDDMRLRVLLRNYLDQRILFYKSRDDRQLEQINATTVQLQADLWSVVVRAAAHPTPVTALAVSGMNDVLNSQGYTQAAWWNRIPFAAWGLMGAIAICSNLLIGYGVRLARPRGLLFLVLPLVLSISFLLLSDIDSPRRGTIRVRPENMEVLRQTLHAH
jgi:hypothetical protein